MKRKCIVESSDKDSNSESSDKESNFKPHSYTCVEEIDYILENHVSNKNLPKLCFNIDLGWYNVENESVNFKMRMKRDQDHFYSCRIDIPDNYPATDFAIKARPEEGLIFKLYFSVQNIDERYNKEYYKAANEIAQVNLDQLLFINAFYNKPHELKFVNLTESEKIIYKGFGKKLFYLALKAMKTLYKEDLDDQTLVLLEASGGSIRNANDQKRLDELMANGMLYGEAKNKVCAKNNRRLVKYYQEAFGFQKVTQFSDRWSQFMFVKLSKLIQHCI